MDAQLYDASIDTTATKAEREAAVGKRATLTLTGVIVDSSEHSEHGGYVVFEVDARWGLLPNTKFGMDLECFKIEDA